MGTVIYADSPFMTALGAMFESLSVRKKIGIVVIFTDLDKLGAFLEKQHSATHFMLASKENTRLNEWAKKSTTSSFTMLRNHANPRKGSLCIGKVSHKKLKV